MSSELKHRSLAFGAVFTALGLVLWAVIGAPLGSAHAEAESVETLLKKLRTDYREVSSLEANFVQRSIGLSYMEPLVQKGTLALKRPSKMRWSFAAPSRQHFLSDGSRLWIVSDDHRTCTVYRSVDPGLQRFFSFLTGGPDMHQDFEVRLADAKEGIEGKNVLQLSPKETNSGIGTILLQVDQSSGMVTGVVNMTSFGDRTETQLTDIRTGREIPNAEFEWAGRDGYREIAGD